MVAFVASVDRPSFVDRVIDLLERVDYRRADSAAEREAIYRLRYDAYLREGAISATFSARFDDEFDDKPNGYLYGIYVDGLLTSSLRLHIAQRPGDVTPAFSAFSEFLEPEVEAGRTIIDPNRFVADFEASKMYPELAYVTTRLGWAAGEYFGADTILATARTEHQAFYKRTFGHRVVCPARPYPSLKKPLSLMFLDYKGQRERVQERYPFFRSTVFERRMLFERPDVFERPGEHGRSAA
jgi:N-acyl-L-homoserine lactone synthetase